MTTNAVDSSNDQGFFIDSEINRISQIRDGSLFFSSETYCDRLKDLLKERGGGLFRWIEIQIDIFSKKPFKTPDEIEHELKRLENHTTHGELNKEYARLLALLENFELLV
jgi:hypothetical protein